MTGTGAVLFILPLLIIGLAVTLFILTREKAE